MGLDNYWTPNGSEWDSEPAIKLDFNPPLQLGSDGDLFEDGWFRGKRYYRLVRAVTGMDLHTDIIYNHEIHEMAKQLEETSYEEAMELYEPPALSQRTEYSRREYNDLCRMFRAYADAGAQLEAWY